MHQQLVSVGVVGRRQQQQRLTACQLQMQSVQMAVQQPPAFAVDGDGGGEHVVGDREGVGWRGGGTVAVVIEMQLLCAG